MAKSFFDNWVNKSYSNDYHLLTLKHSSFIGKLKILIILIVVLLVTAIVIWPLTNVGQKRFKLNFGDAEISKEDEKVRMINPRLHGLDNQNQPYNITADNAVKTDEFNLVLQSLNGDILLKDGGWVNILSDIGNYNIETKKLDLNGSVNLFTDSGYEAFTEIAHVNLNEGMAAGDEEVFIQGPLGTIKANGFVIRENGDNIFFYGGVHLIAYP